MVKIDEQIKIELEQIELEIKFDEYLDYDIGKWWKKRGEYNKESIDNLVIETTRLKPDWVKSRRLEFLTDKVEKLNKEYLEKYQEIQEWRNKANKKSEKYIYNSYADYLEKERNASGNVITFNKTPWRNCLSDVQTRYLLDIEKEIKKIVLEINCWNNLGVEEDDGKFTEDEIEIARQTEPFNFLEFERHDIGRHWAKCPFHKEDTASFCYFEDSKRCSCFGCSWSGNTVDLVMKLKNIDFRSAVAIILNK